MSEQQSLAFAASAAREAKSSGATPGASERRRAPKPRARGRKVLKARTVMARSGLKDKRARVTRASASRKTTRSSKAKAIAVKTPARRTRTAGSRA